MDRFKRPPTGEGFRDIGRGGEITEDDSVEGHIMGDEIKDQGQDTEGHTVRPKLTDDDTEGHTVRPKLTDDDTEGHTVRPKLTDDDTEGHMRRKASDDDDTEGHGGREF